MHVDNDALSKERLTVSLTIKNIVATLVALFSQYYVKIANSNRTSGGTGSISYGELICASLRYVRSRERNETPGLHRQTRRESDTIMCLFSTQTMVSSKRT